MKHTVESFAAEHGIPTAEAAGVLKFLARCGDGVEVGKRETNKKGRPAATYSFPSKLSLSIRRPRSA